MPKSSYDFATRLQESMLKLLEALTSRGEISSLQVYKGFQRFVDQLDDLALDTPHLHDSFQQFYEACIAKGFIDPADQSALEDAASRHATASGEAAPTSGVTIGVIAQCSEAAAQVRNTAACPDGHVCNLIIRLCFVWQPVLMHLNVQVHSVAAFRQLARSTVQEYFASCDTEEVARILQACSTALCTCTLCGKPCMCSCPACASMRTSWTLAPSECCPRARCWCTQCVT